MSVASVIAADITRDNLKLAQVAARENNVGLLADAYDRLAVAQEKITRKEFEDKYGYWDLKSWESYNAANAIRRVTGLSGLERSIAHGRKEDRRAIISALRDVERNGCGSSENWIVYDQKSDYLSSRVVYWKSIRISISRDLSC